MSDDLVKRLRGGLAIGEEAANRIEELEAKLEAALQDTDEVGAYVWELVTKLAIAVKALEYIKDTLSLCSAKEALTKIKEMKQ